jgi:CubicO group peptidase (beta-lactamase class C family)
MLKKLKRTTPESHGIESQAIARFVDDIQKKGLELHSFMMQRGGDVVAEAWWKPYAPEITHELYSLSKSFTSTAVGFAVQEGLLTVEDYVISFFPEFKNPCENLKRMKVKHLLSMNTGHTVNTMDYLFRDGKDCVTNFLEIDVEKEPGTHFLYNTGATYMLSAIVQKLVGKKINDYLDEKLYRPLGISYPEWDECPNGISFGGFGLNLKTEDILKFSIFLQNKGVWEGERLLNAEWIDEATSVHSDNSKGDNPNPDWIQGYGYQFWMCRHGAYRGDGAFGQYCLVMNEQNVTIVITGGIGDMQAVLDSVWEILLPAMGDDELPENNEEYKKLVEKLQSLDYPVEYNEIENTVQNEIDGNKYIFDNNDFGIKGIKLCFNEDGCDILLDYNNDRLEFKAGHGKGEYGVMLKPSYKGMTDKAVISGTWVNSNEYEVTSRFYKTPYILKSIFKFDDDKVTMSNEMNFSFDGKVFVVCGKA